MLPLACLGAGLLAGIAAYALFLEPLRLELTRREFDIDRLPAAFEGFEFVHVTDTHSRGLGARERQLLEVVGRLMPRPILFTGDVPLRNPRSSAVEVLRRLRALGEVWLVPGNHDKPSDGYGDFASGRETAEALGVTVLFNRAVPFEHGGARLWLAGVDDPDKGQPDLTTALAAVPDDEVVLLLAHSPDIVAVAGAERIDLILSGHTHGGQIRLPGLPVLITRLKRAPRQYAVGVHRLGERTTLFVSRGVGLSRLLPARLGCRPEVSIIILRGGNSRGVENV